LLFFMFYLIVQRCHILTQGRQNISVFLAQRMCWY
jgi:hypothetical protein